MNGRPFPPESYINRDTSWIEINRRVLQEAQDERHPLIERAKFLSIFSTNLDEFFMVRVSGLREQVAQGVVELPPDGHPASATLDLVISTLTPLVAELSATPTRHSWPHSPTTSSLTWCLTPPATPKPWSAASSS